MSTLVEAFTAARGTGDLGRARLALQRFATPVEVVAAAALGVDLPPETARWLLRLKEYCTAGRPIIQRFHRVSDDPGWTHFRGTASPADSELIVGFAGGTGNLYQPSPIVLQQLDADRHDLLLLRRSGRGSFLGGAGPHGSFGELVDALEGLASGYSSVLTVGASMGGAPAIFAGLQLGARRAIAIGGSSPPEEDLPEYFRGESIADVVTDEVRTETWVIYGTEAPNDTRGAERLASIVPRLRRIGIAGIAAHSLPHACFQRGQSSALYDLMIDGQAGDGDPVVVELPTLFTPPEWARPGRAPDAWQSNMTWVPMWLQRRIMRIPLPATFAQWIEETAHSRLGLSVRLRRTKRHRRHLRRR